jgi:uncharacterized protein (TIGR03382 family)
VNLVVDTTPLDFASFRFDSLQTRTFHILNTGSAPVSIDAVTFVPDAGTMPGEATPRLMIGNVDAPARPVLARNDQLDVVVTARPSNRIGPLSGHFLVHSETAGVGDRTIPVTGTATAAILQVSAPIDFSAVDIDRSPPMRTATITNTGTLPLTLTSLTAAMATGTPGAYTVSLPPGPGPFTIAENGGSLTIPVVYRPTAERRAGDSDGVVIVAGLSGVGVIGAPTQAMIPIVGRGIDRKLFLEPVPEFPPTFRNPGDTAPIRPITVRNTGEAALRVSAVMISGDPVWQLVDASTAAIEIPGGGSHDFQVRFAPTTDSAAPPGELTIVNDDNSQSMKVVPLTGTAVPRLVTFGPLSVDVGLTGVGVPITAATQLSVLNMDPSAAFTIHAIELSGDQRGMFHVESAPSDLALPVSGAQTFSVTFTPTAVGQFETTAQLLLDHDDVPQATIKITGKAVFVDAHGSGGCSAGGGAGSGAIAVLLAAAALRRRRRAGLAIAVGLVTGATATARADGIDLAVFAPTPATTGTGFQLQSPDVGASGSWVASAIMSNATDPLVIEGFDDARSSAVRNALVERSTLFQLGAAYAFLDRFEAGVRIPLYSQSGQANGGLAIPPVSGRATGNLTLHVKARLIQVAGGLTLGASGLVVVPTASEGKFTGSDKLGGRLLVLGSFTPAALASRLTISVNAGAILRGTSEYANIVQKSGVAWGGGASFRVARRVWATAEVFGETTPSGQRQQTADQMTSLVALSPSEWLAGVRIQATRQLAIGLAGGRGVTDAIGTPNARGVLSLSFAPGASAAASRHAEAQVDDRDSDGDGIVDSLDKCPNEPEDKDMFEDSDGCPDPDNDGDGVPDALDKCPLDPEDKDGFQDDDGCPDKDNDGDGIPDKLDKCPNEPEDKDGFEDLDGCPDLDNDHDGIPDDADKCPNEPETINGIADNDGCPDKGDTTIVMSPDRIETLDPIQFTGLKPAHASIPLLAQVGATLRAHPEIVRLRITVHVQPTGDATADQTRSERRAQALRDWLLQWGVAPARLEVRGFGGSKPLVPPDQRGASKINDRVELVILERS